MQWIIDDQKDLKRLGSNSIGFLGGSFNPVHDGHIALADHVLDGYVDYVVFCPHSLHPDKEKILVPIEHRVNMVLILKEVARYSDRIYVINPLFIQGTHNSKFTDLCISLKKDSIQPSIICGIDSLFRSYYSGLCQFNHYVGIRRGCYAEEKVRSLISGQTIFFETPYPSLSSTEIRSMISDKNPTEIHEILYQYIIKNNLFCKSTI